MYRVPVEGSITGVEVDPRSGFRSVQPMVEDLKAVPNERCQRIAPVAGSRPYARAFSVVAIRVPSYTSGWA